MSNILRAFRSGMAVCVALAYSQTPAPAAKRVTLSITALDGKGNPVTDLTGSDFKIFDNGKPQTIAAFENAAPAGATVSTLILLDLLNSVPARREYISKQITSAVEPLDSGDSVFLLLLNNRGGTIPVRGLNRNPDEDTKLEGKAWNKQVHALLEDALKKSSGFRPFDDSQNTVRASTTFRTLLELGAQLNAISGPKTIVWITTGVENRIHTSSCNEVQWPSGAELFQAARCRKDCQWQDGWCLDYEPFLRNFGGTLEQSGIAIYNVIEKPDGVVPMTGEGSEEDTLTQLAGLTGGRTYSDGNIERAFADSRRDLAARYRMSFEPSAKDGKFHKLRVACSRKGVHFETRRGYLADQPQ
jgi:VWFA-related protein